MKIKALLALALCLIPLSAHAEMGERLKQWREMREHRQDAKKRLDQVPQDVATDSFEGREILVHVAANARPANREMVVVLHGGTGNANHIFSILGQDLNDAADEGGFVVAYLNGSAASRLGGSSHAWNAGGGCCGQPFAKNVDDVAYIKAAVKYLTAKYNVDPKKVYGIGHSNGAMMTQRLMCETDLYQAAIPISGPLNIDNPKCLSGQGKKIWAIHGAADENVPVKGGFGTKGVTNINYKSQDYTQTVFHAVTVEYKEDILPGIDHSLQSIAIAIEKRDGRTFGRDAALFFGLAPKY